MATQILTQPDASLYIYMIAVACYTLIVGALLLVGVLKGDAALNVVLAWAKQTFTRAGDVNTCVNCSAWELPVKCLQCGRVHRLTVTGEITVNKRGEALKDKVRGLLQQGYVKLVLDLGGVSYIDSSGLGQLVQSYTITKTESASLKLVRLNRRVGDLLAISKLSTVFDIHETEAAAIASFPSPGEDEWSPRQGLAI